MPNRPYTLFDLVQLTAWCIEVFIRFTELNFQFRCCRCAIHRLTHFRCTRPNTRTYASRMSHDEPRSETPPASQTQQSQQTTADEHGQKQHHYDRTSSRRMSHFKEYKFFRSFSAKVENWPMRKAEALWRRMREKKIAAKHLSSCSDASNSTRKWRHAKNSNVNEILIWQVHLKQRRIYRESSIDRQGRCQASAQDNGIKISSSSRDKSYNIPLTFRDAQAEAKSVKKVSLGLSIHDMYVL
uniref:Uncharacterized protein n=1 Tax=Trichogramma kaykai TaxID=54128 RepID=A0ABD2W0R3_9HYME